MRWQCGTGGQLPSHLFDSPTSPLFGFDRPSTWVFCILDDHALGHHYAPLRTGNGIALWAVWLDAVPYVAELPDCLSFGPWGPDITPCGFFHGHGGTHSWETESQGALNSHPGGPPPRSRLRE
ncbi:hypothetical protein ACFVIM_02725 [Streptomyces sp. NPDC057638]|uniref:hypothetical protein n=1 Tax=Streptomyces sp. NPDC057638 TaxID=3346190 RepID=UPI0036745522